MTFKFISRNTQHSGERLRTIGLLVYYIWYFYRTVFYILFTPKNVYLISIKCAVYWENNEYMFLIKLQIMSKLQHKEPVQNAFDKMKQMFYWYRKHVQNYKGRYPGNAIITQHSLPAHETKEK